MSNIETIAKDLKYLRKFRQYTLKDLAERTGLSISYLSDIERGRTQPAMDTWQKIVEACGCEIVIKYVEVVI